jgi:tetratricopeptide (TPR) repeat protein
MRCYRIAFLIGCWLIAPAISRAADDSLKKVGEPTAVKCQISSINRDEVKYTRSGKEETVPTHEIESIRLADEPPQLNLARNAAHTGGYENGLKQLDKIDIDAISRAEAKGEAQYLRAYCNARLALGGSGDVKDVKKAGDQLMAFINANPNSYHYYAANELAGDLLVALGKYEAATNFYKALATAPADAYKIKAGIDTGRAKLAEKKSTDAQQEFETALSLAEKGKSTEMQKLAATIGKAACLGQSGKPEEGIKLTEEVIKNLPPEEADLHAWAYVVQGNCYRQMPNHAAPAVIAFLHVDLLYSTNPQLHAEALWNLASLWPELKRPDRAGEASALLKERYPNSTWAKSG